MKIKPERLFKGSLEKTLRTLLLAVFLIGVTSNISYSQEKEVMIKGTVIDSEGVPMPGVAVVVKGTTVGTSTDMNGTYELFFNKDTKTVLFAFIGMVSQEVDYTGQAIIDVKLLVDSKNLDEVVVTGYQTISKERVAGSFTIMNEKELNEQITTNIMTNIAKTTPGLLVGANGEMQIRGINTFSSDKSPLIVIDGFPVENKDINGNVDSKNIASLVNPDDIKSVTILKDASAASIYGVRASNGVIVIETKSKGKKKFNVQFSSKIISRKYSGITDMDHRASTSDMIDYKLGALERGIYNYSEKDDVKGSDNDQVTNIYRDHKNGDISDLEYKSKLDALRGIDGMKEYEKEFKRNYFSNVNSMNISGSGDKVDYYVSLTYDTNKGTTIGKSADRYSIQSRTKYKLTDKLNLSFNLYYSEGTNVSRSMISAPHAWQSLRNQEGDLVNLNRQLSQERRDLYREQGLLSPEFYADDYKNNKHQNKKNDTRYQVQLDYKINKNFNFVTKFQSESGTGHNTSYFNENSQKFVSKYNKYTTVDETMVDGKPTYAAKNYFPFGGIYDEKRSEYKNYNWQNILSYNFDFLDKHKVSGILGYEVKEITHKSTAYATKYGYNPQLLSYSHVPEERKTYDGNDEDHRYDTKALLNESINRYFSLYGNFAYDYDDRYVLTGNIRLDQTNLFGQDDRFKYKPIWSMGAAWNMTNEEWFDVDQISYLRLKGSFGYTGNINRQTSPYLKVKADSDQSGNITATITTPANPELRWEKTSVMNLGFESRFLNDRLGVNFEYYEKIGTDLLSNIPLDPTYGFSSAKINASSMKNTGIDLSLWGTIYDKNDLEIDARLNFSHNKNVITKYYDLNPQATRLVYKSAHVKDAAVDALYAYNWAGLDKTGYPTFYDKDGEAQAGNISNFENSINTVKNIGTYNPTVYGSFNPTIRYKNISLSAVIGYKFGHYFKKPYYFEGLGGYIHDSGANAWKKEGDEKITDIPRLRTEQKDMYSVMYLHSSNLYDKADNITLDNVSLSYTMKKLSVFNDVVFAVQAADLGLIWAANDEGLNPNLFTDFKSGISRPVTPLKPTFTALLKFNF